MSILIKGMEMPKSCRACPMIMNCDDCEGWECVCVPLHIPIGYVGDLLTDKRRDDCPLVPVPPHGRLIDADALMKQIEHDTPLSDVFEKTMRRYLKNAPTIIPAEEGET